ncbi:MAG: O-antigen ligase family protein [Thermoleophilaceae bacterium]|nr:O-antigen ligase family protein [Thermoleophilaceae bacterium]
MGSAEASTRSPVAARPWPGGGAAASEAAAVRGPAPAPAAPPTRTLAEERLALWATAAAIALAPLLVPTGAANTAPADLLIAVAVSSCLVWAGSTGQRLRFPYLAPFCLLAVGGALGAMIGPVPTTGAVALVQDLWLLALCWAVVNIGRSSRNLGVLLATWAYSSICWVVLLYVGLALGDPSLTGQTARQGARVQLTLADPSYAANYFFVSIMVIWATGRPRRRGARLVASALLVAGIVLTGSNSGAMSLAIGVAVAGLLGVWRRLGGAALVAALAFLVLGVYLVASSVSLPSVEEWAHNSRVAFLRDGIGRETSVEQRGMLLQESLRLYREGSPLGEGPVSTKTRLRNEMAPFEKEAHNDYLAALTERGAVGFVGVLLLVSSIAIRAFEAATRPLARGFGAVVPRPNAMLGAVVGTMAAGTVYELFHVRHVWALFALVAALALWGRE